MSIEKWNREEWIATLFLLVLFFPMGMAALWRKWAGERVWR
jgi:hypothetical protein